jgi:hypothetical protein
MKVRITEKAVRVCALLVLACCTVAAFARVAENAAPIRSAAILGGPQAPLTICVSSDDAFDGIYGIKIRQLLPGQTREEAVTSNEIIMTVNAKAVGANDRRRTLSSAVATQACAAALASTQRDVSRAKRINTNERIAVVTVDGLPVSATEQGFDYVWTIERLSKDGQTGTGDPTNQFALGPDGVTKRPGGGGTVPLPSPTPVGTPTR